MKEHRNACQKGALEKPALAKHAWESHHPIKWEETTVVDQARTPKELLLKEAIHIWFLNPPPPHQQGGGSWSCLDAGWQPWEQGSIGDSPLPVAHSHATSSDRNDATHGYKWQVLTLASYFHPEDIWSKH